MKNSLSADLYARMVIKPAVILASNNHHHKKIFNIQEGGQLLSGLTCLGCLLFFGVVANYSIVGYQVCVIGRGLIALRYAMLTYVLMIGIAIIQGVKDDSRMVVHGCYGVCHTT